LYPLSLNLSISIAQSQAKLPQAATALVIHLSGVAQNFIHFSLLLVEFSALLKSQQPFLSFS